MANRKIKKKGKKRGHKYLSTHQIVFALAMTTLLLYSNTLQHDFVLDDAILITDNSLTKKGMQGIPEIFKHDTFYGFFNTDSKSNLVSGGRYRPLSQVLFAIEYELFGANPFWGHLFNLIYFSLCCISVYYFTYYLLSGSHAGKKALLMASCASLMFIVHPIHTEVVANIKGRDEILSLLFSLWAAYFAMKGIAHKRIIYSIYAGALFFLALLSKEVAVGFLITTPLSFYLFKDPQLGRAIKSGLPLLGALLLYICLRISVMGLGIGNEPPLELMNNPFLKIENGVYVPMTTWEKWPQIIFGLGKYLQLSLIPHPLTHDYYPHHIKVTSFLDWGVLLSIVAVVALLYYAYTIRKKNRVIFFGIIFFFATLFVTSNIVFPVGTHLSERFLFTPSVGFCLIAAWIFARLIHSQYRSWGVLILLLVTVIFSMKTYARNKVWKDNFTLFTTDVRTSFASAKAQNAAGGVLIDRAREIKDSTTQNELYQQSLVHLDDATKLHPTYKNAYLLKGNAHFYLRNFERSIAAYDRALSLDPNYQEAHRNRAFAMRDWGRYHGERLQDLPRAIQLLENAAKILKEDHETHRLLGVAYGNMTNTGKAIEHFSKAVSLREDDAATLYNLGMAYLTQGDSVNANRYISRAKRLNPKIGR